MSRKPDEEMEKMSKRVETLRELKSFALHQDFVYKSEIIPSLQKLPANIKDKTIKSFNHYYKVNRNIIGYLWKEAAIAKKILEELSKDSVIKEDIENLKETMIYEVSE